MSDRQHSSSPGGKKLFSRLLSNITGRIKEESLPSTIDDGEDSSISLPTNVKHEWHVGVNADTKEFVGLPPAWVAWLQSSNIR